MFNCFSLFPSRQKLRERGRLDGLIRGGTAAVATHDWKPRSPSWVYSDAAIEHAQVQHMSRAEAQTERIKEINRGGQRQRRDVEAWRESWKSRMVKKNKTAKDPGLKCSYRNRGRRSPYFLPPFRSLLLSRTASHALHTHPHVSPPPPHRCPKHLVLNKHYCLLLNMKKHVLYVI